MKTGLPEPGLIMVFPSYVFHHAIPFEGVEIRTAIAFGAKPHEWMRQAPR